MLRYRNVFFYNPLCRNSAIRNIIMESGIKSIWALLPAGAIMHVLNIWVPVF